MQSPLYLQGCSLALLPTPRGSIHRDHVQSAVKLHELASGVELTGSSVMTPCHAKTVAPVDLIVVMENRISNLRCQQPTGSSTLIGYV